MIQKEDTKKTNNTNTGGARMSKRRSVKRKSPKVRSVKRKSPKVRSPKIRSMIRSPIRRAIRRSIRRSMILSPTKRSIIRSPMRRGIRRSIRRSRILSPRRSMKRSMKRSVRRSVRRSKRRSMRKPIKSMIKRRKSKSKVRIPVTKGKLPGYHVSNLARDRRKLLIKMIKSKEATYADIIRRLNVLSIYNKSRNPELSSKVARDMAYIRKKFEGTPYKMSPKRSVKSKKRSSTKKI